MLVLILFGFSFSYTQTPVVNLHFVDERASTEGVIKLQRQLQTRDTAVARKRLQRAVARMRSAGYADASIDHYKHDDDTVSVSIYQGPWYQLTGLQLKGLPTEASQSLKLEALPRPFDREDLRKKLQEILYTYQGEGYPFAAFSAPRTSYTPLGEDSISVQQSYQFTAGDLVKIDSINLRGSRREPDYLLYRLIGLKPGDFYQQNLIDDIPRVLNNTPYYERTPPVRIRFNREGNAILEVRLRRQKAGKFDLLLGILPPDDPNTGRLKITGLVDAVFVSALEMGERIEFKFRQLSATSQILRLGYEQPYPAGLPVSPSFHFDLQKQEERFLNRSLGLAGRYAFSPQLQGELFYKNRQTALLDTNLASGAGGTALPEVMSGTDRRVGLRLQLDQLDYPLNPRRGIRGNMEVGVGSRSSRPDIRLGDDARAVLEENQAVQEVNVQLSVFIPIGNRGTVRFGNHTYILAQSQYFQNDQYQIGGGRSIRGFEDNRFFSDRFTFFSAEYRLLLDRNAHLMAFTDYAYLNNRVDNSILRPWSFGLGLQIDTGGAGLISLTYGIGQLDDGPFRPARGKLHIGLVNNF